MPNRRYNAISIAYWFLLLYVVAALIWWFISLEQQNHAMYLMRTEALSLSNPEDAAQFARAEDLLRRKHAQYIGEGVIFLLLILAGALLVFRAIKKELNLSRQQQNFMMAITHELKTPIAAAKLNIETIQRRKLDEEKTNQLLQSTLAETNRLNDLADNILLATRLDDTKSLWQQQHVLLNQLLSQCINTMQQRYSSKKWQVAAAEEDYEIKGDPILLKLMINNLLENAAKYAVDSTIVRTALQQTEHQVTLSICDEGPGIPDQEKKKVFQKFYRMGEESTRTTKGTGLGLFLVKRIVEQHNGKVALKDNQPKGVCFTITLPRQ